MLIDHRWKMVFTIFSDESGYDALPMSPAVATSEFFWYHFYSNCVSQGIGEEHQAEGQYEISRKLH